MDLSIKKLITAIRSIFFVCGLTLSSWAPMVPFAKSRLLLDEAGLGILLLFLGTGALIMMPVTSYLSQRFGNRIIILFGVLVIGAALPFLAVLSNVYLMSFALLLFGSGIGMINVAMNASSVQLQRISGRPIMSSLHGLFSVGGLFGSLIIGFLIKTGLEPLIAAIIVSILVLLTVGFNYSKLLTFSQEKELNPKNIEEPTGKSSRFSWLKLNILFLGSMGFIVFMVEGAMLDWSALFLFENKGIEESWSGLGYAVFSMAMAGMRLFGDRIVDRFDSAKVVTAGAIIAGSGIMMAVVCNGILLPLIGFFLLGCGAANIIPVFFSEAGKLTNIKTATAIAVITTMGYSGQLLGPVGVGFIAHSSSLSEALQVCAILLFAVGALFSFTYRGGKETDNKIVTADKAEKIVKEECEMEV
ncbi:MFS transporter [Flavobacterium sp.]|uniref:MFS transporter n=1 Tax=Flavobacterium sp. TaxID=239 RepID=UPI002EDA5AEF